MKTGMKLPCSDGGTRRCVPVLCQYIGDMEEQWLLTCTIKPTCPKCYHRGRKYVNDYGDEEEGGAEAVGEDGEDEWTAPPEGTRRTDSDALRDRDRYKDSDSNWILRRLGYHIDQPFSFRYPFTGILDAVGPDLLHQISKCFKDYLIDQWIWPVMKGTCGVSEAKLKAEFDARFMLMPTYALARKFKEGIFTEKHFWSVHDIKEMMKVIVGALVGICPTEGVTLVREYLHIHRLAHYSCHTEESLQWMESAVTTLFCNLTRPTGIFVAKEIIPLEYILPQKLHYFLHYPDTVREKGALPSYSTDRTEIFHKPLRNAYQRSNKNGEDAIKFILKDNSILSAFQSMIYRFEAEDAAANSKQGRENGDEDEDGDPGDDDRNKGRGEEVGDGDDEERVMPVTTHTWPKAPSQKLHASVAETSFGRFATGLHDGIQKYFREREVNISPDPLLLIANSVTMKYPSWLEDEEAVNGEYAAPLPTEHLMQCDKKMVSDKIRASKVRHESVIVSCPDREGRGRQHTMNRRRVAQVLLLFQMKQHSATFPVSNQWHRLAYVSWFDTKKTAAEETCSGMFRVRRSKKREVVEVVRIEHTVHLIPKFGNVIGETVNVRRRLERVLQASNAKSTDALAEGESENRLSDLILDHYSEFFLNTWIDPHIYKLIY
jgi:hypothetical protein